MQTEFFNQIAPYLTNKHGLALTIFLKDGQMTISALPVDMDGKHLVRNPQLIEGPLADFATEFFPELDKCFQPKAPLEKIVSNADSVKEEVQKVVAPAAKAAPKKKVLPKPSASKGTKMDWVKYHLSLDKIKAAQEVVDKARKGGGLPGKKVDELQKLVDKAKAATVKEEKTEEITPVEENAAGTSKEPVQLEIPEETPAARYSDGELSEFKVLVEAKIEEANAENTQARAREKELDALLSDVEDEAEMNKLSDELKEVRIRKLTAVKSLAEYRSRLNAIGQKTFGICAVNGSLIPMEDLKADLLLTVNPNSK